MTNKLILQKAIEKAIKNGWYAFNHEPIFNIISYDGLNKNGYVEDSDDFNYYGIAFNAPNEESIIYHPRDIIFSHEFAKAFWGGRNWESFDSISYLKDGKFPNGDECYGDDNGLYEGSGFEGYGDRCEFHGAIWQYHLQQMVLEKDPIKYLEKFL